MADLAMCGKIKNKMLKNRQQKLLDLIGNNIAEP
jgi:hypothetical protein